MYVSDRALDDLSIGTTRDGFVLGVILWENFIIQNHIANVMLIKGKTGQQKYVANGDHLKLTGPPNTSPQYDFSDLANLHVYDLYYKVRTDAKAWWQMRSSSLSGEITLSLISDM